MWWVLGFIVILHLIIIARAGFSGLVGTYIIGSAIWFFYPGYSTGLASWILTNIVVLGLSALGSIFPSGGTGIVVAGIGGYLIGKNISKL